MKFKQLAYKATTETGNSYVAQWFQGCHLWRIKLDVDGQLSTLLLSSVERRIQNRKYNKRQDAVEGEATMALWEGLRPYGFTKLGSIKV